MSENGTAGPPKARPQRPAPEEQRAGPTGREPAADVDEQVLSLRESNVSYSSIAKRLELRRASDAHRAFIRAVATRTPVEQQALVAKERTRLDRLEAHIRIRDADDPEKLDRRLGAVESLRAALPHRADG
jgi:hypothetical protein